MARPKPEMFSWTAETLMRKVHDKVDPSEEYNTRCATGIDAVASHLQRHCKPNEIIKSGSFGKGTQVQDMSDIDLVVYLPDKGGGFEKQIKAAIQNIKGVLNQLDGITLDGETRASVKAKWDIGQGQKIDIDVLPTFINYANVKEIYEQMLHDESFQHSASSALAPLQRDFVRDKPAKVKQLIRVVKFWRKTCLQVPEGKRYPTSYPLELITIGEWEEAGSPQNFDLRMGLFRVMKSLQQYNKLRRVWYKNYDEGTFRSAGIPRGHFVMDPANPFNNVMDRCDEWEDVSRQVGLFLNQALFRGLPDKCGWN